MSELQIDDIISSGIKMKELEIFEGQPSVGSLSDINELLTDGMYQFLINSRNIIDSPVTGSEEFPGSLLKLQIDNVQLEDQIHDLLVKYYMGTYVNSTFRKPFTEEVSNSIIVINKVNKYGRYQIGTETYRSVTSPRHIKVC